MNDAKLKESDRLYANDGNGFFKEVTKQSGLLNFGLSLSAAVADYNNDGWLDIYVSNDFASPDFFYLNNHGLIDLVQMDMTPADNRRNKANMASMNINSFWEIVNFGMHHQYMFNSVQINQGIGENDIPHFSDIAQFTGMASTDWSWAALCADFDNNGYKDVFITNGTRRDINNKDYFNKIEKANYKERQQFDTLDLTLNMPSEAIDSLDEKGFSNGAAYADLDNDGDLELIINNIDAPASIFKNNTMEQQLGNYVKVRLEGNKKNPLGIGAKVILTTSKGKQVQEQILTRGFQSSVEPVLHFGLDTLTKVEHLIVYWSDGKIEKIIQPKINTALTVEYEKAELEVENKLSSSPKTIFTDIINETNIKYIHKENNHNDFNDEVLLPHTYSRNGPAMAVADVNKDGLEDFFVGGASEYSGALFIQQKDQTFISSNTTFLKEDILKEDIAATFFDADNDGDADLYVVSGSNEFEEGSPQLQDRLYLNNGSGVFKKTQNSLPNVSNSGSCVKAADFDLDGDLDLFVGGWIVPKNYPMPAKSYLLRNDGIVNGEPKFVDATEQLAPMLTEAGMVTDAVWIDFNKDKLLDLVVVGEWMPVTILKNTGDQFENVTEQLGLQNSVGWWYSILSEDFNNDGFPDLVAGNLGLNYKYKANLNATFDVYTSDYDKNGKRDIVLGYYDDKGVQYPVRGRQCSAEQIPAINIKYKDYSTFAEASLADIYHEPDLEAGLHYQAQTFASTIFYSKAGQSFEMKSLPVEAQLSSINAIIAKDLDNDKHLDLILAGNLFGAEVETPRNDASYGVVLKGDAKGNFNHIPFSVTGLKLGNDTKTLASINVGDSWAMLVGNNADSLQLVKYEIH